MRRARRALLAAGTATIAGDGGTNPWDATPPWAEDASWLASAPWS
ncbi:hypothetical protein ACFZDG_12090 [Kitasatospora xanthocidica]